MASTFSTNLNLELMADGEKIGTWGGITDTNLTALDTVSGGRYSVSLSNVNVTVTQTNARNPIILLGGVLTGNVILTMPAIGGKWIVNNGTTGAFTVTFASAGAGTSVVVTQSTITQIYSDATNIVGAAAGVASTGVVPIAKGGTGQITAAAASLAVAESKGASFSANKGGSSQTISSTLGTLVTFGTEVFDVGSYFSTDAWHPPAGTALINAQVTFTSVTVGLYVIIYIYKNGLLFSENVQVCDDPIFHSVACSIIDQCNGTDFYTVLVSSSDSSYVINGNTSLTFFQGTMV